MRFRSRSSPPTGLRSTSTWDRIHRAYGPRIWTAHELRQRLQEAYGARLHHRDVIGTALRRLQKALESDRRLEVLSDLEKELRKN